MNCIAIHSFLFIGFWISSFTFAKADEQVEATDKAHPTSYKGKGTLKKREEVLTFDIGKQPCGSVVKVKLTLKNESGYSLDLKLLPSCSCTKLDPSQLKFPRDETIDFVTSIEMPDEPKLVSVAIACQDAQIGFSFVLAVKCEVVSSVAIVPRKFRFASKDNQRLQITFSPQFKGNRVEEISLVGAEPCKVVGLDETEDGKLVTLEFPAVKGSDTDTDQTLVFEVKTSIGKSSTVSVPISFSDRVRINPSTVTLRVSGERLIAMMFVTGPDIPESTDVLKVVGKIPEQESKFIDFKIESVKKRAENSFVVIASISKDEFRNWFPGTDSGAFLTISRSVGSSVWRSDVSLGNFVW